MEILNEREDEVMVFDILPEIYTGGTSYDYYRSFPLFDEEFYYMLECATRNNADPEEIIRVCQEVHKERNQRLLGKFGGKNVNEIDIDLDAEEISYLVRQ